MATFRAEIAPAMERNAGSKPSADFGVRKRARVACERCHRVRVRCDATRIRLPCSGCVSVGADCRLRGNKTYSHPTPEQGAPSDTLADPKSPISGYAQVVGRAPMPRAPNSEYGDLTYVPESTNLFSLFHDLFATETVFHTLASSRPASSCDEFELQILRYRGAFSLPPQGIRDHLIDSFFNWVAPLIPVVDQGAFMSQYRGRRSTPPSPLLLQAILLAGSRTCDSVMLADEDESTVWASSVFYRRAKALYDAGYETDPIVIIQALIIIGCCSEHVDPTRDIAYWTQIAIMMAQDLGMHRSMAISASDPQYRKLCRRIWWTLFSRDRCIAAGLSRLAWINAGEMDVEMVTEDDFTEPETEYAGEYFYKADHIRFYLKFIKLLTCAGSLVPSGPSEDDRARLLAAVDGWAQDELRCGPETPGFWPSVLELIYNTAVCLICFFPWHPTRYPIVPFTGSSQSRAFQASSEIVFVVERLLTQGQIQRLPALVLCGIGSAIIWHFRWMKVFPIIGPSLDGKGYDSEIDVCLDALQRASSRWLVASSMRDVLACSGDMPSRENWIPNGDGL